MVRPAALVCLFQAAGIRSAFSVVPSNYVMLSCIRSIEPIQLPSALLSSGPSSCHPCPWAMMAAHLHAIDRLLDVVDRRLATQSASLTEQTASLAELSASLTEQVASMHASIQALQRRLDIHDLRAASHSTMLPPLNLQAAASSDFDVVQHHPVPQPSPTKRRDGPQELLPPASGEIHPSSTISEPVSVPSCSFGAPVAGRTPNPTHHTLANLTSPNSALAGLWRSSSDSKPPPAALVDQSSHSSLPPASARRPHSDDDQSQPPIVQHQEYQLSTV